MVGCMTGWLVSAPLVRLCWCALLLRTVNAFEDAIHYPGFYSSWVPSHNDLIELLRSQVGQVSVPVVRSQVLQPCLSLRVLTCSRPVCRRSYALLLLVRTVGSA